MVVKRIAAIALAGSIFASPAIAQVNDNVAAFVENNLLHILFHEAGHAVIDQFQLPVLGQEEDAADSFATIEILNVYDEPLPILADSAIAQFIMDERLAGDFEISDYYGTHDLDVQRAFRVICYAVGLEPETYTELAENFEIDAERIETCEDDGWLAAESWEVLLEPTLNAEDQTSGKVVRQFDIDGLTDTQSELMINNGLMDEFSDYLNETFNWPAPVTVTVELCNEANAFYDPATVTIAMCAEFVDELIDLAQDL
ncbi:MAG: DUF4344 domain-containing metallopeptidase [Pseudomonadota bacterium]